MGLDIRSPIFENKKIKLALQVYLNMVSCNEDQEGLRSDICMHFCLYKQHTLNTSEDIYQEKELLTFLYTLLMCLIHYNAYLLKRKDRK